MSRIILHIGTHKTATTTLQDTFHINRAYLESQGVIYPHVPPSTGHHILAADWIDPVLPPEFGFVMPEGGPAKMWRDISDAHANSDRTVFISAEAFSRGAPKRVDMKAFRSYVEKFDRIELVCVLRNQLSYLQSIYMQLVKSWVTPPFPRIFHGSLASGMISGVWLDFEALYNHILTGFPPEEIRFLDYDELRTHPHGVIGGMLGLVPGAPGADVLRQVPNGRSNVSPEPLAGWVACKIAAPGRATQSLMDMATSVLREEFGESCRTTVYTKAEMERLIAHFNPRNEALSRRLSEFQPNVHIPLSKMPEDLIDRSQINDSFWVQMARKLHHHGAPGA